ncbi:MAG: hypothetical protein JRH20_22065, partial [Deltaproteobacteria bacterium]|nr:hypothetical protein [Deltaproteobacteria bacterium]
MWGIILGLALITDVTFAGPDGICPGSATYHLRDGVGACITKTGQRHGQFGYSPKDGSHVRGKWRRGKRHGGWLIQNTEGATVGWVEYRHGTGDHVAFYGTGHIREQGILGRGKRLGTWLFFEEDGGLEGIVR